MRNLLSTAAGTAALIAAVAPAPASAQTPFSVSVYEEDSDRRVQSNIEYEAGPNTWQRISATKPDGTLTGSCPGSGRIRAEPSQFRWELGPSQPKSCGGAVNLRVKWREISDLNVRFNGRYQLDRIAFGGDYARLVVADLRKSGAPATREGRLLEAYVAGSDTLTEGERQAVTTLILNQTSATFQRVDLNGDSLVSKEELKAASQSPD